VTFCEYSAMFFLLRRPFIAIKLKTNTMKTIITAAVFTVMMLTLHAQSYELRIIERGQQAHVQIRSLKERPLRTEVNKVTDIVFGVKWRDTGIEGLEVVPGNYKMKASGGVLQQNGYRFQAFGAMQTPYAIPTNWETGKWVDIVALKIAGEGQHGPKYVARLELAEADFHITTGPNVGIDLVDETPHIVGYGIADIAVMPGNADEIDLQVVKYGPRHSHLTWAVETPEGIRGYIVERKINNVPWEQLAELTSEGQYIHVYVDEDAYDGIKQKQTIQYRVRVLAEIERMSDIRAVDFSAQKMFVEVYPNPASDKVQITMTATETDGDAYLEIYSTDGKLVYRNALLPGSVKEQIDLASSNVDSGSYTVHLVDNGEIIDVRPLHVMR